MPKRPVMLVFHQGAFVGGADDTMAAQIAAAKAAGFKPKRVDYTLSNLPQAVRDAKQAAAAYGKKREVVAYGESAGGGLASLLAARGKVDSAVSYSGVNNMTKWFSGRDPLGATPEQLQNYSATAHHAKSPILALTTAQDPFVDPTATQKWAARDPLVKTAQVGGMHIASTPTQPNAYQRALKRSIAYLQRHP